MLEKGSAGIKFENRTATFWVIMQQVWNQAQIPNLM